VEITKDINLPEISMKINKIIDEVDIEEKYCLIIDQPVIFTINHIKDHNQPHIIEVVEFKSVCETKNFKFIIKKEVIHRFSAEAVGHFNNMVIDLIIITITETSTMKMAGK